MKEFFLLHNPSVPAHSVWERETAEIFVVEVHFMAMGDKVPANEYHRKTVLAGLSTSAFSRSGLIEQLKFEGFTAAQAEYGVQKAYLCRYH
jgi:hypothetical protein